MNLTIETFNQWRANMKHLILTLAMAFDIDKKNQNMISYQSDCAIAHGMIKEAFA